MAIRGCAQHGKNQALNADQTKEMERLATLIKERHIRTAGAGLLKPRQVVDVLRQRLPQRANTINLHLDMCCWRHFRVRPTGGDPHPHRTDDRYCIYDEPDRDYLYRNCLIPETIK